MSDRTRTETGQYAETVTLERVIDVFEQVEGPAITSSDIADALDCSTEAARQKLKRLHDQGRVRRRKTGRTVLWWLTDEESSPTSVQPDDGFWSAEPGSSDEPTDAAKTDEYLADTLANE
jgi:predicted transcriptional regulator of viral defense system